jgi:hypothetical protein
VELAGAALPLFLLSAFPLLDAGTVLDLDAGELLRA